VFSRIWYDPPSGPPDACSAHHGRGMNALVVRKGTQRRNFVWLLRWAVVDVPARLQTAVRPCRGNEASPHPPGLLLDPLS
jgi:hypothetical protein